MMIDKEFIERCEILMKPEVERYLEKRRKNWVNWTHKNQKRFKLSQEKYFSSEKGKIAIRRRSAIRQTRLKHLVVNLSKNEIEKIRIFYQNCPPGYEVDHIIPISKGGKHDMSNLQYLTVSQNRKKSNKLINTCS